MKGIAITLGTREDGEAISRIEKLIGHKIPRVADEPVEHAVSGEQPVKMEKAHRPERRPRKTSRGEKQPAAVEAPKPVESSPVLEDMKSEWNGPLPSFLSVSAA
jgi:superfamily II DNA/RNA helicase